MRTYNVKSMDERIISYLFLLVIIIDIVQAVPKINNEHKKSELNKKLNKKLQNYISKHFARKQSIDSENPNGSLSPTNVDTSVKKNVNDDGDDKIGSSFEDHNANELDVEPDAKENLEHDSDAKIESEDNAKTRSLAVGDTFTTKEMLEVAKKLISKVKKVGKGIVSSAKNAYELADKLFEGYFLTFKRIVMLRDFDIDGLDALQALSLNGDIVDTLRTSSESFTESPRIKGFKADPSKIFYGFGLKDYPTKCHYKVLKKLVTDKPKAKNYSKKESNRRQAVKLKKSLGKNRKLVVNPGRRGIEKNNKDKEHGGKYVSKSTGIKQMQSKNKLARDKGAHETATTMRSKKLSAKFGNKKLLRTNTNQKSPEEKPTCRWKYECQMHWNLNTCRLHPVCSNHVDYQYVSERKVDENLRRFHEMVGIDMIDEEVEKILQVHISRLKPENMKSEKAIESLTQYFNRILYSEDTTPKMRPDTEDDLRVTENPGPLKADDDAEARRILGLIPINYKVTRATKIIY